MQISTGDAARSELLISEPKTRVRPQAAASAHRAHPVSSSRDQQPQTGSGPRPEVLDYRKSTVGPANWLAACSRKICILCPFGPQASSPKQNGLCSRIVTWSHHNLHVTKLPGWLRTFLQEEDGHAATAEANGCQVCNLILGMEQREQMLAGFYMYEDWDSQEPQYKYAATRVQAEFRQRWLALDLETFKWEICWGRRQISVIGTWWRAAASSRPGREP
jgi:hypothetical protein